MKQLIEYKKQTNKGTEQTLIGIEMAKHNLYDKAIHFFEKAITKGDLEAYCDIGVVYERQKMFAEAMYYYEKAVDEANCEVAAYNIGNLYQHGKGVSADLSKAIDWYKKAMELGYGLAYAKVASFYQEGNGVEKDERKAAQVLEEGVKYDDPKEQDCTIELGCCYHFGQGVEVNYQKEFELFEKAAKAGNGIAIHNLAKCYKNGWGVEKNYGKCVSLLKTAIKLGQTEAYIDLCAVFVKGELIEPDYEIAEYYSEEGMCHDIAECCLQNAELHLSGCLGKNSSLDTAIESIGRFLFLRDPEDELYKTLKGKYPSKIKWWAIEKTDWNSHFLYDDEFN